MKEIFNEIGIFAPVMWERNGMEGVRNHFFSLPLENEEGMSREGEKLLNMGINLFFVETGCSKTLRGTVEVFELVWTFQSGILHPSPELDQ